VTPQVATPGQFRYSIDEEANIQRSICEHCGQDIGYCGQDRFPSWYHLAGGGRVCGTAADR